MNTILYLFVIGFFIFMKDPVPTGLKKLSGYNLTTPSSNIILPQVLTEISGIASIDSTTFACIQDEIGVVFIYNSRKGSIINQIPFAGEGDFEAVTVVNRTIYILRSEGIIYEVSDFLSKSPKVQYYSTGIPARESEGLCYDHRNGRLLIACKQGYRDEEIKNKQLIYSFDLKTKKLSKDPVFVLDIKLLRKMVKDNKIKIPGTDSDKIDELDFRPSDIAINPLTGKLFLISASDNSLIVADMKGTIESLEPLKKEFFRQAEGITFNQKGDLYITNEGAGKDPTLVRFNYRKTSQNQSKN